MGAWHGNSQGWPGCSQTQTVGLYALALGTDVDTARAGDML